MTSKQFILFVFVFFLNGLTSLSQETTPTKAEIAKQLKKAIYLMHKGDYDKSLIACRSVLRNAIVIKDNEIIATTYNTIGSNFDLFSNTEKALFYYNKAIRYANKTQNFRLKNLIYTNLGSVYCFDKKEYQKGILQYRKALECSIAVHDSSQLVQTNLNMTWAFFDVKKFSNGSRHLQFANAHHAKYGSVLQIVALNRLNAMYYAYKKEPLKADYYFKKAIRLGNASDEKLNLALAYQEYAAYLKSIGQHQKAYENLSFYIAITNQINQEEKQNKIKEEGLNLEIEEYKREIEKTETEFKIQQKVLEQEKAIARKKITAIVFIFLISIILLYFYVQNYLLIQRNKFNTLRSETQQNIINASLSGQEIERKKIAAFLHDNISALLSSAALHLRVFSKKNQTPSEEITKAIALLGEAHERVRDLSHELIPAMLVRFGLLYALEDLCEKNSNSMITFEYRGNIDRQKRYNEEFEIKIYYIISELFNNINKHSQATIAKVFLKENTKEGLQIQVFDNGKGFVINSPSMIYGFGINQVKSRINSMKGSFFIDSKLEIGTIISIEVPIVKE